MPNEIDQLMDLDPLELSSKDKDGIIAYYRKQRGAFESGVKPKKSGEAINIVELGLVKPAASMRRI